MISRYEAWLNGVALSSVNPDILILDIEQSPANIRTETFATAKRHGSRIYKRRFEKASVTIRFAIRKYDTADRRAVCSDVVRWAKNGGVLETNDRNGQRLRCVLDTVPVIASALRWTDPLTVTFTAYALPFWEEKNQSVLHMSGSNGEGTLYVPGDVDGAMIEATVTSNGSLSTLALSANGKTITLSGISVGSGGVVELAYNDEMVQSIKANGTSVLNKRTGADDLVAVCGGTNTLGFTANANVDVNFKVRGLWI